MASTDSVWTIMSRLGPEDGLVAVQTRTNSSPYVTAGNDWAIEQHAKDTSGFYYKDTEEAVRLAAIVESNSQENRILRDLAKSRYLCAQSSFALDMCNRSYRLQQRKHCTPTILERMKCGVKLARAVDILCRPQFGALATCLRGAGGDASKCLPEVLQFDICTEAF